MDKDTDESKYQKNTCLENFNVRFINTESNVIGTLQNERDYKVILTCNNLNTDNVTCEKIIGHLKYDSNRLCLFFVNQFGNIVVADLEFNEQTKEFAYVKREDNPHITTIQYTEDEIVQSSFGEDTYANYIFWTSENSGGLQKYLVDAKNVNLLGEPVFPFEGITKVEIRDGGMIPQGMVKYFISTTNDLGVESNKWDTDWYYVKDNDIEKTKQIVLTLNITNQDKIRNVIIYRLQHTSGGVTAHCVGNFQPSESIVIDNGTSQITIDPDLLLQQNHINDNVNCLKVFQDRLFVSTKKDNSDIEAKWFDNNLTCTLENKDFEENSLSKTTHFYDGNGYVFGVEYLDENGEVKARVKNKIFGLPNKEGKFGNCVRINVSDAYPYARAFVAPSEIKKFVDTTILNSTLVYVKNANDINDKADFESEINDYFPSSLFRANYHINNNNKSYKTISKYKFGIEPTGNVIREWNNSACVDIGCEDVIDINLDSNYLKGNKEGNTYSYSPNYLNSGITEYRHGLPTFASGNRGNEFCFMNTINGWYGKYFFSMEDWSKDNDINLKHLLVGKEKFFTYRSWYKFDCKNIEDGFLGEKDYDFKNFFAQNELTIKTYGKNKGFGYLKDNQYTWLFGNPDVVLPCVHFYKLEKKSEAVLVNNNFMLSVLPFNSYVDISNVNIKINSYLTFNKSKCYTFCDLDKSQGITTEKIESPITDSTFGMGGIVFEEDTDTGRIGVCLPRITINPGWDYSYIDEKIKMIPYEQFEYNVLYTPLYAPRSCAGVDIKQKTINVRKAEINYKNEGFDLDKQHNLLYEFKETDFIKRVWEDKNVYFNNKYERYFSGLVNKNSFDIFCSEPASINGDYAPNPRGTKEGTRNIWFKNGQIKSRLCCGYKFENLQPVQDWDGANAFSACALTKEETKLNLIGYAYNVNRFSYTYGLSGGVFNFLERQRDYPDPDTGEDYENNNSLMGYGKYEYGCFPTIESYYTKADTPLNYKGTNSLFVKLTDSEIKMLEQTFYKIDKTFIPTGLIINNTEPQRQDKIMYQASTIQSTANGSIYATIGDVYKGEQRYIATIPDASCPNQVLDIIDAEVYTTTDPNCYYKMEDESLLLHTDDYNKAFRKNPNLDSEGARKMIYEFTGIIDNKTLDYVDYRLYWSLPKSAPIVEGTSAFDKIFSNSSIDLDQTAGAITKIESFGDKLFVFQETKVSVISYNERGIVQLEGTNPISIMNEQSVQGFTPMTDHFGLQKHYQCCKTDKGIYWLDSINKELFMIDESCQVDKTGISIQTNMYSWFIKNASKNFVLYYNYFYKDLMMSLHGRNGTENITLEHSVDNKTFADSIAFSEFVGGFSSFYDLYRNNIGSNIFGDSEYMVNANGIYEWSKGQYTRPFYTCFVASENSFMDKVFYNLDYHADCYIRQGISDFYAEPYEVINQSKKLPKNEELYHPAFTHFRCWNNYQDTGIVDLTFRKHGSSNLKRLFRTWRIQIPRDKKVKRDRIRNQWAKILLGNHKINEDRRYSLHDFVLTFDTK